LSIFSGARRSTSSICRFDFASLLITSGADIKTVQARVRHASAKTTLDTYGHLWPDADESTRAAVAAVIRQRIETPAYQLRTGGTAADRLQQVRELAERYVPTTS
jgi:integrase